MSAQLSFAIGTAMISAQQIMHTKSIRGAIMMTKASQKQIRPKISSDVDILIGSLVTDEYVAPYDLEGPRGKPLFRCWANKDDLSLGMRISDHEALWACSGVANWTEGPREGGSLSRRSRRSEGPRTVSLSEMFCP